MNVPQSKMASVSGKFVWLETLKRATKTSLLQDGRRKIHYTFPDKAEMVEEYDVSTSELLVRKWKQKTALGKDTKWEFEVGEDLRLASLDMENIMESRNNPIFTRQDTPKAFQWRIRNLPYPLSTYNITVDDDVNTITVRTSNKKYYKKFTVADMERAKLPVEQSALSTAHAHNTLIITYQKPPLILEQEKLVQQELIKMKSSRDGDVGCNPS